MDKLLIKSSLFNGIGLEEVEILLTNAKYQYRTFSKGQLLALQDSNMKSIFALIQGSAIGEMSVSSGKAIHIEEIKAPRLVAPAFLFGSETRYPVSVIAETDIIALEFTRNDFIHLLSLHQRVMVNYLNMVSNKTQFLSKKIQFLSFNSIKGKLAFYLLEQSKMSGTLEFRLTVTIEKLADYFGITRPSLSRVIREMNQSGELKSKGRNILILDPQALESYIDN